jgi:hypothetical protein
VSSGSCAWGFPAPAPCTAEVDDSPLSGADVSWVCLATLVTKDSVGTAKLPVQILC